MNKVRPTLSEYATSLVEKQKCANAWRRGTGIAALALAVITVVMATTLFSIENAELYRGLVIGGACVTGITALAFEYFRRKRNRVISVMKEQVEMSPKTDAFIYALRDRKVERCEVGQVFLLLKNELDRLGIATNPKVSDVYRRLEGAGTKEYCASLGISLQESPEPGISMRKPENSSSLDSDRALEG